MGKHLEYAKELRSGVHGHINCAQSVLIPYAEEGGITEEQALQIAGLYGSGMGIGSTCGAISGAFMVLGLLHPDPDAARSEFMKRFRANHENLSNCADLLRRSKENGLARKEHCDGLVYEAVGLLEELLES